MYVPTYDPLATYCSELAPPRDRDGRPPSVEYTEQTVRALAVLAVLARRYGPVARERKKANPVWVDADGDGAAGGYCSMAARRDAAGSAWTSPAQTRL
ncbi:MAG TPA: hypothetical protein VGP82_16960 [Ktedonobacterales bacterium]|nr:hypothetical protein [Ktedonobacterales bacterium]